MRARGNLGIHWRLPIVICFEDECPTQACPCLGGTLISVAVATGNIAIAMEVIKASAARYSLRLFWEIPT